jgi:hypothetical protein
MDIGISDVEVFQLELVNPEFEQVYIKEILSLLLLVFLKFNLNYY